MPLAMRSAFGSWPDAFRKAPLPFGFSSARGQTPPAPGLRKIITDGTLEPATLSASVNKKKQIIMGRQQTSPRAEYRKQESQRIMEAASLSASFPKLKHLKVDLSFRTAGGGTTSSEIKYIVNLDHTKAVFRFDCLNHECVRGDFDLSEALAKAVATRETVTTGEMQCEGWRSKDTIEQVKCSRLLRYKLSLGF
jgi:hypothetical protein